MDLYQQALYLHRAGCGVNVSYVQKWRRRQRLLCLGVSLLSTCLFVKQRGSQFSLRWFLSATDSPHRLRLAADPDPCLMKEALQGAIGSCGA